jgi:hypothetical protein
MNFAQLNDAMFAETSSKENTGIKELFIKLAKNLCLQHLKV